MLVTSSVCHSTSYSATSLPWPLDRRDVDLPHEARHSGESCSTVAAVVMIWPALAWLVMRLAVCTAGAEDVAVLEHHRPEVTADADRDRLAVDLERRRAR